MSLSGRFTGRLQRAYSARGVLSPDLSGGGVVCPAGPNMVGVSVGEGPAFSRQSSLTCSSLLSLFVCQIFGNNWVFQSSLFFLNHRIISNQLPKPI